VSVTVAIEDLPAAVALRSLAYLVTTGDEGAKVVAVDVRAGARADQLVVTGVGPGSRAHVAVRPAVTLVLAPTDLHDLTLLIDGDATVDGEALAVTPTSAVLHRPAPSLRHS